MKPAKWDAIRVVKRMANVIEEQISEIGYKDEGLTEARQHAKLLARALTDYLEKGA